MSLPISLTPSAVLPATNIHPHGHHKQSGSQLATLLDPTSSTDGPGTSGVTDSKSSSNAAPDGSTHGLFSTIFSSLEGVIGANTGVSLGSLFNSKV